MEPRGPGSGRGRVTVETFKSAVEMFCIFYSPGKNELLRFPTCVRPDGSLVPEIPRSSWKAALTFLSFVYFNRADTVVWGWSTQTPPPNKAKRGWWGPNVFVHCQKHHGFPHDVTNSLASF